MSTWIKKNCVSFFQMLWIKVTKTGRVPRHIAFIMDGNRRFAKKKSCNPTEGHHSGFDKLSETLKWCLDLGIPEVTIYAFSIENFKRTEEEVNALMELARDKFQAIIDELDEINDWGIRIHVAGRLSLLPKKVQELASKVMLSTMHNNKLRLNVAYAYTGRDEISRAASQLVEAVLSNKIEAEDIDETLVTHTLEIGEPELLIRTSGEVRLSDFLLWQVSNTVIYFTDVLWPEFSVWNLLAAIIHFQRHAPKLIEHEPLDERKQHFLEQLENDRSKHLEKLVSCTS